MLECLPAQRLVCCSELLYSANIQSFGSIQRCVFIILPPLATISLEALLKAKRKIIFQNFTIYNQIITSVMFRFGFGPVSTRFLALDNYSIEVTFISLVIAA